MNEPVIGIDLGTTNSEVAVCINGKIEIIGENDNPMLPSVVGISPDGKLIIGSEARNQYALYPEKTLKSIKRKMGSDEKVSLGEKEYLPQEISAMILRKLKENAEKRLKQKVSKAVITVPALFNDAQRQATRDAGKIAGLEVLRIINEPTAACLAYENKDVDKAKYVLAFDLGGGTFDVSLVKVEDDVTEVIVSHGDNHLGGDDFDQVISEWLQQAIYDEQKSPNKLSKLAEYRLDKAAEAAKMQLSESAYANIIENNLTSESTKSLSLEKELSVSKFNELIQPFVSKTVLAVRQCLADAKMKPAEIDEIILVGGSTRSSIIKDTIEKEFGVRPRNDINPDLAVVYGAAIMAARLMGEEDHRILVDITPYTFGVSCMGELNGETSPFRFAPIIKAGSPLPINKEEIFYTMYDNQETVEVRVFQGENEDARKNTLLGRFKIENLSEQAANSPIVMSMKLDLDGILRTVATEKATGINKHISIDDALAKLSDEQIAESSKQIQEMFGEQDDDLFDIDDDDVPDSENASNDSNMKKIMKQLQQLVDKVSSNMDEVDKADTDKLLSNMLTAAKENDKETFQAHVAELEDILFYMETES